MTATKPHESQATPIVLGGLLGSTLTGWLAGLGLLRILHEARLDGTPRLGWEPTQPHRAIIDGVACTADAMPELVGPLLVGYLAHLDPFGGVGVTMKDIPPERFQEEVKAALKGADRFRLDLLGALGSDLASKAVKEKDNGGKAKGADKASKGADGDAAVKKEALGLLSPQWCVMDGSQRRELLSVTRKIANLCQMKGRGKKLLTAEEVLAKRMATTLLGPWTEDDDVSLHLDAVSREYAYRWGDPGPEGIGCDGGASLLALIGLSLLPAVPTQRGAEIVLSSACCTDATGGGAWVSWPIWRGNLGMGGARRMLAMPEIVEEVPPDGLSDMGVQVVYRAHRRLLAKGVGSFAAGRPAWRMGAKPAM